MIRTDAGKRIAPSLGVTQEFEDLYWYFLAAAAACVGAGLLFIRDRADLWLQAAGAGAVAFVVLNLLT